jgi:putative flippase GtrA
MPSGEANASRKGNSVVRWLAAGVVFIGINTAFLYVFVEWMGLRLAIATLLSAEICTLLRFFINEHWVFRTQMRSWKRLLQFHIANGGAFLVWWAGTIVLARGGINYLLASILAVGLSTGFSFASSFFWIWRKKHLHPAA